MDLYHAQNLQDVGFSRRATLTLFLIMNYLQCIKANNHFQRYFMKAIDDYKGMVFDVSRVLSIFETCTKCYTDYLKQPTQQKENAYKSMVEQWRVEDVDLIKNKIISWRASRSS